MGTILLERFKALCYADMAVNYMFAGDIFNNEWRENLTPEDKEYMIWMAQRMADKEKDEPVDRNKCEWCGGAGNEHYDGGGDKLYPCSRCNGTGKKY